MTTTIRNLNPIQSLIARLRSLDRKFTKKLVQTTFFPEWWSDDISSSPSAVQQLKCNVARHLNIELDSILDDSSDLRFKDSHCKFKHASNKSASDLQVATSIAASLAKIASRGIVQELKTIPDPSSIRASILFEGKSWVDLESLISFCWGSGIPVLYVPKIPTSKKMDGLAIDVEGRPVIVLAKKAKHSGYMLFDLAHELGHIACGHVQRGCSLVDEEIRRNDDDEQEVEANRFALELLTGDPDKKYSSDSQKVQPRDLALAAKAKGEEAQIDPQHIIANWGNSTRKWSIVNAALNLLDPSPTWQSLFLDAVESGIDEDVLQDEDLDYLYMLTRI